MKNIGIKSINMSDIMVYLAMFSTIIDKVLCLWVLIRWKWLIIFQSLNPSGTWDLPPHPNLTWTWSKVSPFSSLESFPNCDCCSVVHASVICMSIVLYLFCILIAFYQIYYDNNTDMQIENQRRVYRNINLEWKTIKIEKNLASSAYLSY